jgi:hypothetical protein
MTLPSTISTKELMRLCGVSDFDEVTKELAFAIINRLEAMAPRLG